MLRKQEGEYLRAENAILKKLRELRLKKYHKRLQIVLFRLMGKSYKEIIELLDCNQTTIWRNVKKYEEFGLDSLLQETRGGRNHAYMTVEEEKAFLARHLKATEAGEFVTIDALFQAYKKKLGRSYTRDAFYQLLKRHGWRNIMPRPEHPKKADAQTIVASKNKISKSDMKAGLKIEFLLNTVSQVVRYFLTG
ncbi:transposase [Streptococcus pneumoniae]|nr:transposase [Streptococcus pneumoniae]